METHVSSRAPEGFRRLAWDVMFASRGRGISFDAHFPNLDDGQSRFVVRRQGDEIIGGLVLRRVSVDGLSVGLIGLVCVAERHRGRGHADDLVSTAIEEAQAWRLDDIILWTGKPRVYEKHGFSIQDTELFGSVRPPPAAEKETVRVWREPYGGGLPAFSTAGYRVVTDRAAAIVLHGGNLPIVAEWSGPSADVMTLLRTAMPEGCGLNALIGDNLLDAMIAEGWQVDLHPTNLQMILHLRPRSGPADPYRLRVLDRI